jgi:N-acetylmuramic acid 6-phosphate etherase
VSDDGRGRLSTEAIDPDGPALDQLSAEQALAAFSTSDAEAVAAVAAARPALAQAVDLVAEKLRAGGRLIYVGAGTSGRLGVLDAAECPPTFGSDPGQVRALIAGGDRALTLPVEGAEDDAQAGATDLAQLGPNPLDCVFGIAAGGTTPYVHGALGEAQRSGASTLFLACVPFEQVSDDYDVSIRAVTGPELLAGSTRLKAGTATKLCLNALTTLVQARLGKVHGNLMVDVNTGANAKLVARGTRLVARLTGLEYKLAGELLERAAGSVKCAAVMHAHALDLDQARSRLAACDGQLRAALGAS